MDDATVNGYNRVAKAFADEWENAQSPPTGLHAIVLRFFNRGPTADIGCGGGRDAAGSAHAATQQ